MRRFRTLFALAAVALALGACDSRNAQEHTALDGPDGGRRVAAHDPSLVRVVPADGRELTAFDDEKQLKTYIRDALRRASRGRGVLGGVMSSPSAPMEDSGGFVSQGMGATKAADGDVSSKAEPAAAGEAQNESITNTQEAGVDEGGIVKTHGDHLVMLRRGRLFSVRVGDRGSKVTPVSMVNVTPPGGSHDAWYDEMLISGDRIVVVGFSYEQGATELGLFDIDAAGHISHRATHFLRSNDYYSSRNYASRLLGDKLVFYMPYMLASYDEALDLPSVKRRGGRWKSIIEATRIYRPLQDADMPVLHTVVTCDLAQADMACRAQGIIGPYGRTFYVSQSAVYVWVQSGYGREASSVVYRLPLRDEAPGAMRVVGAPIDQFSFKEDESGYLNVLVRGEENGGDGMWGAEVATGDVALLRVPVGSFANQVGTARARAYTKLAKPTRGYTMQNRYVGGHVLYGTGSGWGYLEESDRRVYAYPVAGGTPFALSLKHGVDRIEQMGDAAVVIGSDGADLHFTAIDLEREKVADRYRQKGASQGELRSHGFFFKPTGEDEGVLGLPVRSEGSPGYEHLVEGAAKVMFLAVDKLHFTRLGALTARSEVPDDHCVVSCVDWYGNARPIFYRGRVFALLGYELVEGDIADGRIRETGRTSYLMRRRLAAR